MWEVSIKGMAQVLADRYRTSAVACRQVGAPTKCNAEKGPHQAVPEGGKGRLMWPDQRGGVSGGG